MSSFPWLFPHPCLPSPHQLHDSSLYIRSSQWFSLLWSSPQFVGIFIYLCRYRTHPTHFAELFDPSVSVWLGSTAYNRKLHAKQNDNGLSKIEVAQCCILIMDPGSFYLFDPSSLFLHLMIQDGYSGSSHCIPASRKEGMNLGTPVSLKRRNGSNT